MGEEIEGLIRQSVEAEQAAFLDELSDLRSLADQQAERIKELEVMIGSFNFTEAHRKMQAQNTQIIALRSLAEELARALDAVRDRQGRLSTAQYELINAALSRARKAGLI